MDSSKLEVSEIFHSIQGESSLAGTPATFVRLTGCNLRCRYCDTRWAYSNGTILTVDEVVEQVRGFPWRTVTVTGGEPLVQKNSNLLINRLIGHKYKVILETNGSIDIGDVSGEVVRILDLKCPGSGMSAHNDFSNLDRLQRNRDEVKFVLSDRTDFDWAVDVIDRYSLVDRFTVLLSPAWGVLDPRRIAEWMLEMKLDARLQVPLQKVLWPGVDRGV